MERSLVRNALYAHAIADAVGAEFEFHPNPKWILVKAFANRGELHFSDDTQMMLFGAEAALLSDHKPLGQSLYLGWHKWFQTQTYNAPEADALPTQGLVARPYMYRRMAPGVTCMWASKNGCPVEDGRGSGTVMRNLPFALDFVSGMDRYKASFEQAATTHGARPAQIAAIDHAIICTSLMEGATIADAARAANLGHVLGAKQITDLGEGWDARTCLDMAVWAVSKASTWEELLKLSICHRGDSDTVACVAADLWAMTHTVPVEKYIPRLVGAPEIDYVLDLWGHYRG